jgi:hypothetical protein
MTDPRTAPHIVVMPSERMAVVETVDSDGSPEASSTQGGSGYLEVRQGGRDPASRAVCAERPTIERLLAFIREHGYEVDGPHEDEYLSRPNAKVPKTLIRYSVKKVVSN